MQGNNYRETTLSGSVYTRCNQVTINNSRGSPPSIVFSEERFVDLGPDSVARPNGNIVVGYDPNAEFRLINPETGEFDGNTMTHGMLYGILYSFYITEALARDARLEAAALAAQNANQPVEPSPSEPVPTGPAPADPAPVDPVVDPAPQPT